jgi:uncharacterized cysteine cluster protein YcgN (CxxCxxCC family)
MVLTPASLKIFDWMPETCAYRLLSEGKDLPAWHPLVSGDPNSVHTADISVRTIAVPYNHIDSEELDAYVIW